MYVCTPHSAQFLVPQGPKEGSGFLGAGVTDDYEPPCGYWEPNPGPL